MIPGNSNAFNNRKHIPPPFKGLFLQSDPGKNPATLPRAHSELNDGELASSKASSAPTTSELIHTDMHRLENSGPALLGQHISNSLQCIFKSKTGFRWFDVGEFRQSGWWETSEYKSKM